MTDPVVYRKYNVSIECPHIKTLDGFSIQKGGSTTTTTSTTTLTPLDLYVLESSNFCGSLEVYGLTTSKSGYAKAYLSKLSGTLSVVLLQSQFNFTTFTITKASDSSVLISVSPSAKLSWVFTGILP